MHRILIVALLTGSLLTGMVMPNALTRDENLDAVAATNKRPRDVETVSRMKYFDPRRIDRLSLDVPELVEPRGSDENLLDVSAEIESTNSRDWDNWSEWTDCSRSCGGGVSTRERECLLRSATRVDSQCEGRSVEHRLCNKQACPEGTQDFREKQCSERNNELFFTTTFEWVPYTGKGGTTCELSCQAKQFRFYKSFGTALDGTRCGSGRTGICVKGECIHIGCDGTIGSNIFVDACGICGGNNGTCIHHQSVVDSLPEGGSGSGYNKILEIPVGATNIRVKDYNVNYLAVAEVDGDRETYIVNGGWVINSPGEFKTARTLVIYDRSNDRETIIIPGPTTEPIRIMVVSLGEQPLVGYEYWLPRRRTAKGNSEFNSGPESVVIYVPTEEDLRDQIASAGLDFDAVVPPTSITTTTAKTTTTNAPVNELTVFGSQPGSTKHCKSCRKFVNKKKQFCESDYAIHVRILPKRPLARGRFLRYEVEILNNYKSNVRMLRKEYVWISSTCCPRLRPYRHYLLMGRTVKVNAANGRLPESIDVNTGKPHQYETKLFVDQVEVLYAWRRHQIKMSRVVKHIKCKRRRYLPTKFNGRNLAEV